MTLKTNAARLLDQLAIAYELRRYAADPLDLSAERLERELSLPRAQIWKTLVARGDRSGLLFAVIPLEAELDLKALARVSGDRSVELLPLKQVLAATGYVRGAVTALAAKRELPVFVDARCQTLDCIGVSAGALGTELILAPQDYLRAAAARVAAIARTSTPR
jgi:Cys-tRNA(Pro)/Cys-tRNA(Cys) deacylase